MLDNELRAVCYNYSIAIVENVGETTTYLRQIINDTININTFIQFEEYYKFYNKDNIDILLIDYRKSQQNSLGKLDTNKISKNTKIIALIDKNMSCKEKIELIILGFDDFLEHDAIDKDLIAKLNIWIKTHNKQQFHFSYKNLHMDFQNISVTYHNHEIKLSIKEFMILKCLIQNAEKIQTREQIIKYVWKKEGTIDTRTVDVNINRLRNNLKNVNPNKEDVIHTIRSMGYCLKIDD